MTREELKEHCLKEIKLCEIWARLKGKETHRKLYEEHNLILELLEHEPRWIPVSERLPTKEEYIANNGLFIVSDGNRTYAEYFDVYNFMKYFGEPTMNGFRADRCITAWMPLPEPYESQEKENK